MYLYLETGQTLGNAGEFSFVDTFKKYKQGKHLVIKDNNNYEYAVTLKTARLFDKAIKAGKTKAVIGSMRKIIVGEPHSNWDKYNLKHPKELPPGKFGKFEEKHWKNLDKSLESRKKLFKDDNPVANDYLNQYIYGDYGYENKKLENIPIEVDAWCKTQPRRIDVPLYRGIKYNDDWFNTEVEKLDNKNKILYLKTDAITSWSTDINVSRLFIGDGFHILLELVYDGEIYCDLRKRNPLQQEVLLYPGRYKAKIVKNHFRMVKTEEGDIDHDENETFDVSY